MKRGMNVLIYAKQRGVNEKKPGAAAGLISFYARENMTPSFVSQILEMICKLVPACPRGFEKIPI
jgi:hypothetical protein